MGSQTTHKKGGGGGCFLFLRKPESSNQTNFSGGGSTTGIDRKRETDIGFAETLTSRWKKASFKGPACHARTEGIRIKKPLSEDDGNWGKRGNVVERDSLPFGGSTEKKKGKNTTSKGAVDTTPYKKIEPTFCNQNRKRKLKGNQQGKGGKGATEY